MAEPVLLELPKPLPRTYAPTTKGNWAAHFEAQPVSG